MRNAFKPCSYSCVVVLAIFGENSRSPGVTIIIFNSQRPIAWWGAVPITGDIRRNTNTRASTGSTDSGRPPVTCFHLNHWETEQLSCQRAIIENNYDKETRQSNNKKIIELVFRRIPWFGTNSSGHYRKIRYFAKPRPVFIKKVPMSWIQC